MTPRQMVATAEAALERCITDEDLLLRTGCILREWSTLWIADAFAYLCEHNQTPEKMLDLVSCYLVGRAMVAADMDEGQTVMREFRKRARKGNK